MKKRLYPVNKAPSAKRSSFKIIISVLLFSAFILSFSSAPNLNASKPGIQQGILLKGAQHLDRDRAFISDIYSQLESQDGIWSSTINQGEYVRVIFSKNLTFRNDITLYPRTISGKPSIEVYGAGKTRLLANFTPINDNQYNKILLKNLSESQDSFDLRIIGGSVQFDQVIDPTIVVVQIFPDGPGFYTNFTGVVNGTIHWQAVNSSPENDSEYVFANTSNLNETFSLQNITLPPDANITNITVYIAADFWNTTRNQSSIMILSGLTGGNGTVNTNSSVTNKTASPATCSASNCSANWSINPAGGNWNQTTINGLQAGLRSSLKAATAGVNVSQVYVNVTYILDTTPPTVTLNQPADNSNVISQTIAFNATATDEMNLTNMSIYGNWTGAWTLNTTNASAFNNTLTTFNISSIPAGKYIWNVLACDGADNCAFAAANRTFNVDINPPTWSNNQTNTTVAGATVNFSVLINDDISLDPNGYYIFSTNNTGTWVNDSFAGGTKKYVVLTTANASNWTVPSDWNNASNSIICIGGGSPSGGGPATPPSTSNSTNTANLTVETSETEAINITKDGPGTFTNFSNSSGIDKIEVWVKNAVDNVRINFSVFSSNPQSSSIPNPEKVYQYLHITPENINNSLQNATIKFKVNRSWADNNSIKKENISLFKYFTNISQWEELATIYIGSDKNYYSYETNLSNFSYFAIAGNITANTGKNFFSQIIGDMQSFASSNEGKIILGIILVIIILITVVLSTLVRRLRRDAASSKEVYEKWGER